MNALLKFSIGLTAVAVIAVAATQIRQMPGSAPQARAKLQEKTREALNASNAGWASVAMDGQKAIISGAAPDKELRKAIITKIATAEGPGGLISGGVTAVDANRLTIRPPLPVADPFIFIAEREGGLISLSGHVPDQKTRDAIYRLASNLFPGAEISGQLDIASGAPATPDAWLNATSASLRGLSHLRKGAVQASDGAFELTGEAEDETRADAARTLLSDFPEGLRGGASIVIRKPPSSIADIISQAEEEAISPDTEAPNSATDIADAESEADAPIDDGKTVPKTDCAQRLTAAIDARRIGFTSARADIDNPSRDQLRRIAEIFSDCPSVRLAVTGHTDSSGNAARNRQLSGYRADAVRAFLVSVGAPGARITARGVGSSDPVTSNATPAGRERNRRIEIDVITGD